MVELLGLWEECSRYVNEGIPVWLKHIKNPSLTTIKVPILALGMYDIYILRRSQDIQGPIHAPVSPCIVDSAPDCSFDDRFLYLLLCLQYFML